MASFTKTTDIKRKNRDTKKANNRVKKLKKSLVKKDKNPKLIKL